MTTLVALATKDALVFGCDSLGSRTGRVIDPADLVEFFNLDDKDAPLKVDKDGKPLIKSFNDIYYKSVSVPSEHMTHMTKLFSLEPLPACVMLTGCRSERSEATSRAASAAPPDISRTYLGTRYSFI